MPEQNPWQGGQGPGRRAKIAEQLKAEDRELMRQGKMTRLDFFISHTLNIKNPAKHVLVRRAIYAACGVGLALLAWAIFG